MLRHIIVTGNVAAGKSWILNQLQSLFPNASIYPEFINNDELALAILKRRFNNTISTLTFQNFIMDKWVIHSKLPQSEVNIYERLPDDAVEVFAKAFLNEEEYKTQEHRLEELTMLPSYKDMNSDNCTWIKYNNDPLNSNINTLISQIKLITTEFLVIEVTSPNYYQNYLMRNRDGERYSKEDLDTIDKMYQVYTKELKSKINPVCIDL